jgi:predicted HTH transcriptional regulator
MDIEDSEIRNLVKHSQGSLSVEIKRWINPDTPEGIAKIVKGTIAIRNFGGGYFIFGFDDETLKPDKENEPSNVRELFHIDKIQGMIAKYSSSPFEINIEFVERDGTEYPIIVIPAGVKTPVATKSRLVDDGKMLIKSDTIYIRSLSANNTPSTTVATWKDWNAIVEICFDNREADIGRFLRRHFSGLTRLLQLKN